MMGLGKTVEMRIRRLAAVAVLSGQAILSACGGDSDAPPAILSDVPESERFGGTAVIAGAVDIETFNPAATTDELSQQVQQHALLMTLLRADDALRPQAYLAESWDINEDSTRVVFRLRQDIYWQDGEPTTAADVEFTFNALKNPEVGFPNSHGFEGWEGPELIDPYTIRFAVRPRANLLAAWTRLPIMPRHIMSDAPADELALHAFGSEPIGNGPFHFAGRDAAGTVMLEANDDFPPDLGGRPYLDRLAYRNISEPQTQLAELATGGVHYVRRLEPTQLTRARATEGITVGEIPTRAYGFVGWNGKRPLFQDPAMRRALTMAIDRQEIIDAVRDGLGTVANGPLGPWHPAHDSELRPPPYAPDSTAAILERLGWIDSDGDGVRDRAGEPLSFSLMSSPRPAYVDVMTIIQAQLAEVGVRVAVEPTEGSAFVDAITSPERRFDAIFLEWEPDMEIDDRQLFSCAEVGQTFQFASYCSEDLEPILQRIPEARSPEESADLLRQYVRIVNREQPFSFLYFAVDASARRNELRDMNPDIRGDLQDVREWWLHPSARPSGGSTAETH